MTDNKSDRYDFYLKMAWVIYALMALVVVVILVLFVAQDNEERFFYGLMPAASAYVFRPTQAFMSKLVFKFTGVAQPTE